MISDFCVHVHLQKHCYTMHGTVNIFLCFISSSSHGGITFSILWVHKQKGLLHVVFKLCTHQTPSTKVLCDTSLIQQCPFFYRGMLTELWLMLTCKQWAAELQSRGLCTPSSPWSSHFHTDLPLCVTNERNSKEGWCTHEAMQSSTWSNKCWTGQRQ